MDLSNMTTQTEKAPVSQAPKESNQAKQLKKRIKAMVEKELGNKIEAYANEVVDLIYSNQEIPEDGTLFIMRHNIAADALQFLRDLEG